MYLILLIQIKTGLEMELSYDSVGYRIPVNDLNLISVLASYGLLPALPSNVALSKSVLSSIYFISGEDIVIYLKA